MPNISNYNFFYTKDQNILNSYFLIRENAYRNVKNGPSGFDGSKEFYDEIGDILICMHEGEVVGGARIVGKGPDQILRLPMENDNFRLEDVFLELNLKNKGYCEYNRLAIVGKHRRPELLKEICRHLFIKSIEKSYSYLFSYAPLIQSRAYRLACNKLNLPQEYKIHRQINIPNKCFSETGDLKMYLSSLKLPDEKNLDDLLQKNKFSYKSNASVNMTKKFNDALYKNLSMHNNNSGYYFSSSEK